jgi:hypothetical protein
MERFARRAPREIEELGIEPPTGTIRTGERGLLLSIPLPVVADDFYPEAIDRAVIGHSGIIVDREGIRIPVSPYEKSETIRSVSGLVIWEGRSSFARRVLSCCSGPGAARPRLSHR